MLTHQQGKVALTHILKNVVQVQDDEPLYKVLNEAGYKDICHLITMSFEDINSLSYADMVNKVDVGVPAHARALIQILKVPCSLGESWQSYWR